jgi:ferredoxin/flavodoxin---NADP+ reductase
MGNKIISKKFLNSDRTVFELVLDAPLIAKKAAGGNFLILRIDEKGERFPLTVADYDRVKGTITMVIMAIGKSTTQLSMLNEGDEIMDLVGPLGKKAHIQKYEHPVILVGGGVGIAPIYPQAKELKEIGNHVIIILGSRSKDLLFWQERFETFADEVFITTDDGTAGRKGLVTHVLEEIITSKPISHIVAIGPLIMMKFVALLTNGQKEGIPKVPTTVSLNTIMVDGTGMCGGCRFQTLDGGTLYACVDGPDVDGHNIDFNNLLKRNSRFMNTEKKRVEHYNEKCRAEQKFCEDNSEMD